VPRAIIAGLLAYFVTQDIRRTMAPLRSMSAAATALVIATLLACMPVKGVLSKYQIEACMYAVLLSTTHITSIGLTKLRCIAKAGYVARGLIAELV
jgi:hypothetical protein